jgi:SAM-dependent methyltransferase
MDRLRRREALNPVLRRWQWRMFRRALGGRNRFKPFSRAFGGERGRPIDRYYIDGFMQANAAAIRGHVLEVGEARYTRTLGGDRVSRIDVLCPVADPEVTIVADLTNAPQIANNTFDCIVLPQTLQFIYDHHAAVRTLHRILRPGGTVLASLPLILVISGTDMERWGEYWRYTSKAARRVFVDVFGEDNVEVRAHGNLLVATAFIQGFAVADLDPEDFAFSDPLIELLSTVKAVKPAGPEAPRSS